MPPIQFIERVRTFLLCDRAWYSQWQTCRSSWRFHRCSSLVDVAVFMQRQCLRLSFTIEFMVGTAKGGGVALLPQKSCVFRTPSIWTSSPCFRRGLADQQSLVVKGLANSFTAVNQHPTNIQPASQPTNQHPNKQTNKQTNKRTNKQTNKQMPGAGTTRESDSRVVRHTLPINSQALVDINCDLRQHATPTTTTQSVAILSQVVATRGLSQWLPRHLLQVWFEATRAALHVWPAVGVDGRVRTASRCMDAGSGTMTRRMWRLPRCAATSRIQGSSTRVDVPVPKVTGEIPVCRRLGRNRGSDSAGA